MMPDVALSFYLSYAALWILVIFHSLLLLGVVRMIHQLPQSRGSTESTTASGNGHLSTGDEAPQFSAVGLDDAPVSSDDLASRPAALLFVSPKCPSCVVTLYEMEAISQKTEGRVIVVCRAARDECAALAKRHGYKFRTVADVDDAISKVFGVTNNPTAVLMDEHSRIESYGYPHRVEEMEELLLKESGVSTDDQTRR